MDTTLHKVKDMHADEKCPNHKIRLSFSLRIGGKWTTPLHFQDRQWAITLPRCSADRGEMKAWIIEQFGPIDGAKTRFLKIAKELHEDGTPHLHISLILGTNRKAKSIILKHFEQEWDKKCGGKINVLAQACTHCWYNYISKFDGDAIEEGDLPEPKGGTIGQNRVAKSMTIYNEQGHTTYDILPDEEEKRAEWSKIKSTASEMTLETEVMEFILLGPWKYFKVNDVLRWWKAYQRQLPGRAGPGGAAVQRRIEHRA